MTDYADNGDYGNGFRTALDIESVFAQLHEQFTNDILPFIVNEYEKCSHIKDFPARREAFNKWTDSLCKDGYISDSVYDQIPHPKCCED